MSKTILITGGAGFIGSHVVRLFINKYPDYKIVNLDKLTYAGNLENLSDVENVILKNTIFQLENRLKGTEDALNRAIEKYTNSILRKKLINESDESNSICTLTCAGILIVGAYLIPWFI